MSKTETREAGSALGDALRNFVIGLTAFLTVVDLFATQAILPSLARHYQVTPAAMGLAVNATTIESAPIFLGERIPGVEIVPVPNGRMAMERLLHGDVDAACRARVKALGEAGFLKAVVPAAHGGMHPALDVRTLCIAREILGFHDGLAWAIAKVAPLAAGKCVCQITKSAPSTSPSLSKSPGTCADTKSACSRPKL